MKGTFFSADFVEDNSGNLRLLEVNTDTTISVNNLTFLDFSDFVTVLQNNGITKVIVVHKPNIHQDIVNNLSSFLTQNAPFITSFSEVKEQFNRIYPTSVVDASDTFILRMAYDESAVFDSEYAKGTLNLLKLFSDYGHPNMITEFYHSSSIHGNYNTISQNLNPTNLPDCLIKETTDVNHSLIEFYKIGSESENETDESRWENFISNKSSENNIIQKYHYGTGTTVNNKVSNIRSFSIIYGGELSLIQIGQFQEYGAFELPTESIYNENQYINKIDQKHYYEFATNFVKNDGITYGILNTHLVIKSDDSEIEIGNTNVGDELKSYSIEGVNVDEDDYTFNSWHINGNTFPSGSTLTSATIVYKNSKELKSKVLSNITVNNNEDSLYSSINKSFLVYESVNDKIVWKNAYRITPSEDYLIDYDGSTAQVTSNEILIINENGFSLVDIDVENTDTFIIAGTTPINSFVAHNNPCFVSGTKIRMSNGLIKNIEDVQQGDSVLTYDFDLKTIKENVVNAIFSKKINHIVEYQFDNGDSLKCTLDHPIFVENKGWCSFSDELSNVLYELEQPVKKIEVGDIVKLLEGSTQITNINTSEDDVTVYNLQDIENNHNFFANNILVHNRAPMPGSPKA